MTGAGALERGTGGGAAGDFAIGGGTGARVKGARDTGVGVVAWTGAGVGADRTGGMVVV